jgi:hypothetical protein
METKKIIVLFQDKRFLTVTLGELKNKSFFPTGNRTFKVWNEERKNFVLKNVLNVEFDEVYTVEELKSLLLGRK